MYCPECEVYDPDVNDCVDPCNEFGHDSSACQQSGCLITDTTAVQPMTESQLSVSTDLGYGDSMASSTSVAIALAPVAVIALFILLVIVIIWRSQRRRCADNRGKTLQLYFFSSLRSRPIL